MNSSTVTRQVAVEIECPWCAGSARVSEQTPDETFECGACGIRVEVVDAGPGGMPRSRRGEVQAAA